MAEAAAGGGGGGGGGREQDRYLPVANIARIMKKALPPQGKIAKDAKEAVQECLSEFVSFVTSEAGEKCRSEKRKTISGDDVLWALEALCFGEYLPPLRVFLAKYRAAEDAAAGKVGGAGAGAGGGGPAAKRAKQAAAAVAKEG
jgi:nuclear transcription Y subunit beta